MTELVLASGNRGKLRELSAALAPLAFRLRPLTDFSAEQADETGESFRENALIKARYAAELAGRPALADDSGLCVAALGGAPGIFSARYAGAQASDSENNAKLLRELGGQQQRAAKFVCVLALVRSDDDPNPVVVEGQWEGEILSAPRGEGGFGYDPLFLDPTLGQTSAELSPTQKLAHSHRGQAIQALIQALQSN